MRKILTLLLAVLCWNVSAAEELPEATLYTYAPLQLEYINCADLAKCKLPKKYANRYREDNPMLERAKRMRTGILVFTEGRFVESAEQIGAFREIFNVRGLTILTKIDKTTIRTNEDLEKALTGITERQKTTFVFLYYEDSFRSEKPKVKEVTRAFLFPEIKPMKQ